MISKQELRSSLLTQRRSMHPDEVQRKSQAVQERVLALPGWNAVRTVLVYLPIQNEVDTWGLIDELWGRGVQTLAPCCRPDCPGEMDVYQFYGYQDLHPGSYKILEPDTRTCPLVDPEACECILTPGVGFDRQGYRLGFGHGYYDRLLPRLKPRTRIIGLAYDFQIVPKAPHGPHDHPVQLICTNMETIWASAKPPSVAS